LLIRLAVPGLVAAGLLLDEEEINVALKMTNSEVNGVSVVTLDSRIVLGEESNALRVKLKSLIAEGQKQIVLNMDNSSTSTARGWGHWSLRIAARKPRAHRCACAISATSSRKFCRSPSW